MRGPSLRDHGIPALLRDSPRESAFVFPADALRRHLLVLVVTTTSLPDFFFGVNDADYFFFFGIHDTDFLFFFGVDNFGYLFFFGADYSG